MSEKRSGVNHSMRVPVKVRRAGTLERLEAQLKVGTKKNGSTTNVVGFVD